VQLAQIAKGFNASRSNESNERRLQAFITDYPFDYQRIAMLILLFVPRGRITLCLDRTEWNFGKCEVNILMLTARCGEVAVPLFWELLDNKSGNSAVNDRLDILTKAVELLGLNRIGLLVADREFVGAEWVKALIERKIPFCLRLPKTHPVRLPNGEVWRVDDLLIGKKERFYQRILVDGQWLNMYIKALDGGDILYLAGTPAPRTLGSLYRRRWSIETLFQSLKKRGFDLESTHLQSLDKLKKLIGLVSIAFGFCLIAGRYYHQKVSRIPKKSHGYKANSFFRRGKDKLEEWLAEKAFALDFDTALLRAYRWLSSQLAHYQKKPEIFR
jgi:Transposase DDE domain